MSITANQVPAKFRKNESAIRGYTLGANSPRSLSVIAREIRKDWKEPYFGAVPYIQAMSTLDKITDTYICDSAQSIVLYFLGNARNWRGNVAAHIKAELQAMVDSLKQ